MRYLLDSNACIAHLRSGGNHPVSIRIDAAPVGDIGLPAIVVAELLFGALRVRRRGSRDNTRAFCSVFPWLPFAEREVRVHAELRAKLIKSGKQEIGPYDSIIAATALANDLTLVTHNTREFSRVLGLRLEDWHQP
jgi:tRNA(fMet)-specific endonuclease VapC